MSLAESPALDAALESEMDGFDSSSILHLLLLQVNKSLILKIKTNREFSNCICAAGKNNYLLKGC